MQLPGGLVSLSGQVGARSYTQQCQAVTYLPLLGEVRLPSRASKVLKELNQADLHAPEFPGQPAAPSWL